MKKIALLTGSLCLLLLAAGCGSRSEAQKREPLSEPAAEAGETVAKPAAETIRLPDATDGPTQAPALGIVPTTLRNEEAEDDGDERILGHCVSIVDALPCAVDLDGDGTKETVDLILQPDADDQPRWTVSMTRGDQTALAPTDIREDMPHDLWVGDLDEDGRYEIFFHGDEASDDYILYAWRWDLTPILFEPDERFSEPGDPSVFCGAVDGFEDGHIVVLGYVDMLGTHWGVRTLAIGDDGVIGPVSTVWSFDEDADRALIVKKALKAYVAKARKDPGEAFTLEPGTKIIPLCSDGCERMWFETENGKGGVLLLTRDREYMWLIDGETEENFFEFLPYSG